MRFLAVHPISMEYPFYKLSMGHGGEVFDKVRAALVEHPHVALGITWFLMK